MKKMIGWVVFSVCAAIATANAGDIQILDRITASQLGDPANHTMPTVVAFWSLDCPHCKKYLQELGELSRSHEQVQIIPVAVEPLHEEHALVLREVRSEGRSYAYGDEVPAVLGYALDPHWRGELPRALFFDGQGNKLARSGRLSMDMVVQALKLTSATAD
jgi:thiol-disulfide isomerase/thioredoxin